MNRFCLILLTVLLLPVFPGIASAGYYVVLGEVDSEILVSDGYSIYKVDYNYECYSSDFSEGETIYIDDFLSPSWGDTIVVEGWFDTKSCEVTSSEELNLRDYIVTKVLDSNNNIIVEDGYGDQYLVEYGIGCLSMWRYEDKTIQIDIGGSYLDGIGDEIYLIDSEDTCKVWDAEELGSGGGGYTAAVQCPANATPLGTSCYCNQGYEASGGTCIKKTEQVYLSCSESYGPYSTDLPGNTCGCTAGYQWNDAQTYCVAKPVEKVVCGNGKVESNGTCISHTQYCENNYGRNVYGIEGGDGESSCICNFGYKWNDAKTVCVAVEEAKADESKLPKTNVQEVISDVKVEQVAETEIENHDEMDTDLQNIFNTKGDVDVEKPGFFRRVWNKMFGWW